MAFSFESTVQASEGTFPASPSLEVCLCVTRTVDNTVVDIFNVENHNIFDFKIHLSDNTVVILFVF